MAARACGAAHGKCSAKCRRDLADEQDMRGGARAGAPRSGGGGEGGAQSAREAGDDEEGGQWEIGRAHV